MSKEALEGQGGPSQVRSDRRLRRLHQIREWLLEDVDSPVSRIPDYLPGGKLIATMAEMGVIASISWNHLRNMPSYQALREAGWVGNPEREQDGVLLEGVDTKSREINIFIPKAVLPGLYALLANERNLSKILRR